MKIGGFEVGPYAVREEGGKKHLIYACKDCVFGASLADDAHCRFHVLNILQKSDADLIVLADVYERVYNEEQTKNWKEIADLINEFKGKEYWSYSHLGDPEKENEAEFGARHDEMMQITYEVLSYDPIKAYLRCLSALKREAGKAKSGGNASPVYGKTLQSVRESFEKTKFIQQTKEYLLRLDSIPDSNELYRHFFEAEVKPSFIGSRLMFGNEVENFELLDEYSVGKSTVQIFNHPNKVAKLYFVNPPEYSLSPEKYFLLSKTKEVVSGYNPGRSGLSDIASSRNYFTRVYQATIRDLAHRNNIKIENEEIEELAEVVSRYTVGYGILELLLSDRKITDIFLDSPIGGKPVYLVHAEYGQCMTNILYTENEAEAFVSKLRAMSGRPFDEAHPVLDFDLPGQETRVASIGKPLSPDGLAFAFRLHKTTPWTLEQYIDNKFLTPLAAGMLSFFVDSKATMLVTGSRGSGKTSLLSALMLEILQNSRLIVQEDSVTGDSEILVENNNQMEYTTVGKLVDKQMEEFGSLPIHNRELLDCNPNNIHVFALDKNGRIQLQRVSQFSRHKVTKEIIEVTTRSGRKIKVTCDHSLFSLNESGRIVPVKTSALTLGSYVAVPKLFSSENSPIPAFSGLEALALEEKALLKGETLRLFVSQNWIEVKKWANEKGYQKSTPSAWKRAGILPAKLFILLNGPSQIPIKNIQFKLDRKSKEIPLVWEANEDLVTLAGLWLADGCYDTRYGMIVSVGDEPSKQLLERFAERLGLTTREHSDGFSTIISNTNLVWFWKNVMKLNGNAYTKEFPQWIFNASKSQQGRFLRGLFSGDGCVTQNEINISLASEKMTKQIQTLLTHFGIISRKRKIDEKDKTYQTYIGEWNHFNSFQKNIGFLPQHKVERLNNLCSKKRATHDTLDIVPISKENIKNIAAVSEPFNSHDYIGKGNRMGRRKLQSLLSTVKTQTVLIDGLKQTMNSDVFFDEVVELQKIEHEETYVYDFSVPDAENFVCENIIAHNTLELPVPYLKEIGFNVQRLKTRSPIGVSKSDTEVAPEEALRTALRLGDSALILGEVRSEEARVLYEAMRVGAAGNTVLGTIHADSAYSVWDRVVNDLKVPTTSFKATDLVVVARPIRFSGSLKSHRRMTQITEVKKHWNKDPDREGGLLDLMLYDARTDALELMEDNLKESELFERIRRLSGLTLNQIWDDIRTQANAKLFMVELKNQYKIPEILEGEYTSSARAKLALIKDQQIQEHGSPDFAELLVEWKEWVKKNTLQSVLTKKQQREEEKKENE
ncbi:MAG: ATPase, T2SS/T4P/T4SS family [Candidatus Diapherotrites archaeon]